MPATLAPSLACPPRPDAAAAGLPPGQVAQGLRTQLARPAALGDCLQHLLAALLAHTGAQEAAIGWWEKGHVRLALHARRAASPALPPLTSTQPHDPAWWTGAMEEALDQGVCLSAPPDAAANATDAALPLLTRVHAQRLEGQASRVATLILPEQALAPLGAITLMWTGPAPGAAQALAWQALASELAPVLALQRQAHQGAWARLRAALQARWAQWLLARTRRQNVALGLAMAATLCWLLWPSPAHLGGQARIEGARQGVLVAPVDGFVKAVHVHPGDHVRAGQPLADLADQELKLERDRWASQLALQDNAYAAAMTRGDRAEAAQSLNRLEEAQAQLAMLDEQLQRAQLKAPFEGVVIQGDLSQSIGAPVKQGDALLTVASTRRYRVIVDIDERDVARVRVGQAGEMALSALPWDTLPIRVSRITPLAQARDGRNVFEVQAEFTQPLPAEVRPGLMGQAWVQAERQPPLWRALRPLLDKLRWLAWSWGL